MKADHHIIAKFLTEQPDAALAIIEQWDTDEIIELIEVLSVDQGAVLLPKFRSYTTGQVIENVSEKKAKSLIEVLPLRTSIAALKNVDKNTSDRVIRQLPTEVAAKIQRLLLLSNEQVGAYLEADVLTVRDSLKAIDALAIVKKGVDRFRSHVFVVDADHKLLGVVQLTDLIASDPEVLVDSFVVEVSRTVLVGMEINQLIRNWNDSSEHLPVIDSEGIFQGVISKNVLEGIEAGNKHIDHSMVDAANALGELFLIGLTGLFGHSDSSQHSKN